MLRPVTLLRALTVSGVGAVAYGVYTLLPSRQWPAELRSDLRAALTAHHSGDVPLSHLHLRRAWNTCRTLPPARLGENPWLRISGVASRLAEALEIAHRPDQAYDVYAECLAMMQAAQLTPSEHQRAIAVALHLAELAEALHKPEDQEKWLAWSVDQCRRVSDSIQRNESPLPAPHWIYSETLEIALQASAAFHANAGNITGAITAYTELLSTISATENLRSPTPAPPLRRCQVGELMSSLSNVILTTPSPENLYLAEQLTRDGLSIVHNARRDLPAPEATCERIWATLLFNLGAVLEMQDEPEPAREHFERAREHAQSIDMPEGVREAEHALARLDRVHDSESSED